MSITGIDLLYSQITFVSADFNEHGEIVLSAASRYPLHTTMIPSEVEADGEENPPTRALVLEDVHAGEIQSLHLSHSAGDVPFIVMSNTAALHHKLHLPFKEKRRIDPILSLQLQDLVPFEMDDFVIDASLLAAPNGGQSTTKSTNGSSDGFPFSASLLPQLKIREGLGLCSALGVDPRVVTTRTAALAALGAKLEQAEIEKDGSSNALLLSANYERLDAIAYEDGQATFFREIFYEVFYPDLVIADVRSLLSNLREKNPAFNKIDRIYYIGPFGTEELIRNELNHFGDFKFIVPVIEQFAKTNWQGARRFSPQLNDSVFVVIGALLAQQNSLNSLNFRKGAFVYRPSIKRLLKVFKGDIFTPLMFLFVFILFFGSSYLSSELKRNQIENMITALIANDLPGVVPGTEVATLQDSIKSLEEKLQTTGALSALSPLEAIKKISSAIPEAVDVKLDSLTLTSCKISMAGSVPSLAMIGAFSEALKKAKFGEVEVEPKGSGMGAGRVRFVSEVKLCE
jgi:hypothetical protein